jgi:hypothetical protein
MISSYERICDSTFIIAQYTFVAHETVDCRVSRIRPLLALQDQLPLLFVMTVSQPLTISDQALKMGFRAFRQKKPYNRGEARKK